MGLEWHNRQRDSQGRFESSHKTDQIHAYCYPWQADQIRAAALRNGMEICEFVIETCMKRIRTENGEKQVATVDPSHCEGGGKSEKAGT